MKIVQTEIPDLLIIEPRVFFDARGYFFESYNEKNFRVEGLDLKFVQINQSKSEKNVIRGLHYQLSPYAQTKLIRVVSGKIWDVAVDIRKKSPTFGKWFGIELSDENHYQLLVPKGFAHGFSVLSDEAIICYQCDDFYHKESERGIIFNDPVLHMDWKIETQQAIVSEKDQILPLFGDAETNFIF